MANDKRRQKKAQQAKKKRELAKKEERKKALARTSPALALRSLTPNAPFGPVYVSDSLDRDHSSVALITVVVSRKVPGVGMLCGVFMIDRTCLGVKDGYLIAHENLPTLLARSREAGQTMVEAEPLLAQSVVFHAVDYARKLGFSPHPDAPLAMLEPRPAALIETPLCNLPRPIFIQGPYDNPVPIIEQLNRSCGPGQFDVTLGGPGVQWLDEGDEGELEDEIEAEGEEVP